jgi:rhodanese-related sulfurtransferase
MSILPTTLKLAASVRVVRGADESHISNAVGTLTLSREFITGEPLVHALLEGQTVSLDRSVGEPCRGVLEALAHQGCFSFEADERRFARSFRAQFRALDAALHAEIGKGARDRAIVVYCHHGPRSQRAAEELVQQGFRDVYNLTGGIHAWSMDVDPDVPPRCVDECAVLKLCCARHARHHRRKNPRHRASHACQRFVW